MNDSVYGIDLGTTYSAIARISDLGAAEVVPNFEGDSTTPSVVYFEGPGSVIVGAEAKRTALSDPDSACLLVKRHMGTEYPQEFRGETYSPEAISAIILKELVNAANNTTGAVIDKVVITVPAYFGVQERESTRQAGVIAGLDVVGIVTEPVAAALSIGARSDQAETIMVYDLGGGTFDTTIMETREGAVEVIAVDGNRKLGGADWDDALVDLIIGKFVAAADLGDEDPRYDEEFMLDLRLEAEDAKKSLSRRESVTLRLSFDGTKAMVEVTREEFEAATRHLLAQTIEISRRTVELGTTKRPQLSIDRVLLVGGSSRMPAVKAALKNELGWEAQDTEFDLAVAKGAAIYGQAAVDEVLRTGDEAAPVDVAADAPGRPFLPGGSASLTVKNALSRSVGIKFARDENDAEGYISFFAHSNDAIPAVPEPITALTLSEGQTSVELGLYEQAGERESEALADNRFLKDAVLALPKPMPRQSPIEIAIRISGEGLVTVTTTDPASGASVDLEASVSVLTEEQVEQETAKVSTLLSRS
ncbi:molecular chaperone DnaK [Microbacterium testaceum]|uniref:Molecular chaperone DnaK n=1 Tax=Microbacterium testaceum TaxID=2033 RepID=A0A147ETR3_MICTE|nr:Hsp70 family protein [Microbacterium testaceum]KTR89241.1 molecular chaperone DnaK [Microbacterium testaceum]